MRHVTAPAFNSAAAREVGVPEAAGGGRLFRVEPGHWVFLPKFAGNGFRKNLTALPQRAGRALFVDGAIKNCLPWLSPLAKASNAGCGFM
jgi:hypothetical protein